jgi:hypothetical protein
VFRALGFHWESTVGLSPANYFIASTIKFATFVAMLLCTGTSCVVTSTGNCYIAETSYFLEKDRSYDLDAFM